jgi:hypothetical protein
MRRRALAWMPTFALVAACFSSNDDQGCQPKAAPTDCAGAGGTCMNGFVIIDSECGSEMHIDPQHRPCGFDATCCLPGPPLADVDAGPPSRGAVTPPFVPNTLCNDQECPAGCACHPIGFSSGVCAASCDCPPLGAAFGDGGVPFPTDDDGAADAGAPDDADADADDAADADARPPETFGACGPILCSSRCFCVGGPGDCRCYANACAP